MRRIVALLFVLAMGLAIAAPALAGDAGAACYVNGVAGDCQNQTQPPTNSQ